LSPVLKFTSSAKPVATLLDPEMLTTFAETILFVTVPIESTSTCSRRQTVSMSVTYCEATPLLFKKNHSRGAISFPRASLASQGI
jgi:hypothetical protein